MSDTHRSTSRAAEDLLQFQVLHPNIRQLFVDLTLVLELEKRLEADDELLPLISDHRNRLHATATRVLREAKNL